MGGGCNSDEGKVLEEGMSGGGGECPQMANLISLGLLGVESLVMTEHTHKIRAIQLINEGVVNMRTKTVGGSAMKTIGVSVVNILVEMAEWGLWMKQIKFLPDL
jgi:hypothetical protein